MSKVSEVQHFEVTLTNGDQEYSVTLPHYPAVIFIQARGNAAVKLSWKSVGDSATSGFWTIKAGDIYRVDEGIRGQEHTVYLQSGTGGTVVEIEVWR